MRTPVAANIYERRQTTTCIPGDGTESSFRLVSDFASWKQAFAEGNEQFDLINIPANGAIRNWGRTEAISFVEESIRKAGPDLR